MDYKDKLAIIMGSLLAPITHVYDTQYSAEELKRVKHLASEIIGCANGFGEK